MIQPAPIGFFNTGLPAVILAAGAVLLPRAFGGATTLSHKRLAAAIGASALVLWGMGGVLLAVVYGLGGVEVLPALAEAPLAVAGFFLRLSLKSAVIWLPVLALVWVVMAQGVERRRGREMARREKSR